MSVIVVLLSFFTRAWCSEFTANTEYQYKGSILHCVDDASCILNCYDTWSCFNATIIGPYNATLTINCNNKNGQGMTCEYMTIHAENSSQLFINSFGYQGGAQIDLGNVDIYTPFVDESPYSTNTIIKCGVIDPSNTHEQFAEPCSTSINIYSQNGWESVSWSYFAGRSWSLSTDAASTSTMFCGYNYENQCIGWKKDGIFYRCTDQQSACDYNRSGTLNPTPSPIGTLNPTTSPIVIPPGSIFTANTEYQYRGRILYCVDHASCILNCYDTWSCFNATIIGPINAKLTINCNNKNGQGMTCEYMKIYAQNSSQLFINSFGYQGGAQIDLYSIDIYTPLVDESPYSTNTIIKCGVIDPSNTHEQFAEPCSSSINIYSQNGWESVAWTYAPGKSWSLSTDAGSASTMFCGYNYENQCFGWSKDVLYYRCSDQQSLCDYNRNGTLNPTPSPVLTLTPFPTVSDETLYPSNAPIECIDDTSLTSEGCLDNECQSQQPFLDVTLEFSVCKKQPFVGNRYGLWNSIVNCLCALGGENEANYDYSKGVNIADYDCDFNVIKYGMDSLQQAVSMDCDTNGYRFYFGIQGCSDCVTLIQSLRKVNEMSDEQRKDAIKSCSNWFATQVDTIGFDGMYDVELVINDEFGDKCDVPTGDGRRKFYNRFPFIGIFAVFLAVLLFLI